MCVSKGETEAQRASLAPPEAVSLLLPNRTWDPKPPPLTTASWPRA